MRSLAKMKMAMVVVALSAAGILVANTAIAAQPNGVTGSITQVGSDSVSLKRSNGKVITIKINDATVVKVNGQAATAADLKVGMNALVLGQHLSMGNPATENPGIHAALGNNAARPAERRDRHHHPSGQRQHFHQARQRAGRHDQDQCRDRREGERPGRHGCGPQGRHGHGDRPTSLHGQPGHGDPGVHGKDKVRLGDIWCPGPLWKGLVDLWNRAKILGRDNHDDATPLYALFGRL